jgi:hypothetical protein
MTSMNVSRARAALTARGIDGAALFNGAPGVYRFRLPRGAWADMAAMRERHARLLAHAG